MKKNGMLLVGHGSKLPYNKELIESVAKMVEERSSEFIVKPCFMSMNTPTIQEQLEELRKEDIERLVVVPLFLAHGMHTTRDIPGLLGLEEGQKRGEFMLDGNKSIPLVYADPIGSDPLLADLMIKNAHRAIEENS
ncbi:MAG: sirohydrochlorin nickelochelatase [Methanoculleaceae archaeon]